MSIFENEREQALEIADGEFDEEVGLLRGNVGPVRYHTRLEPGSAVHPTRESMVYAAALLESAEPWRHDRAVRILNLILPLQDTVPSSATCGIWPWYFEEPLDQMAPPDWNWADFLGVQLVRILQNDRTPLELRPAIVRALGLAAAAIRKRHVRLSYTNIAVMGIYVCVMSGRILNDDAMLAYGRERLMDFVQFTRKAGGFPEYNSPTYTVVLLAELTRMLRNFSDDDGRDQAREIHDLAWAGIAAHWHGPSRQWAGPHSRSYSTLLEPETRGFLQRGLSGRASLDAVPSPSLDWCDLPIQCPEELVKMFATQGSSSHHVEVVVQGEPPLEGHVHMEPEFVLSSAERATFWNQSRALIAYAPAAGEAAAMTVRFLHDGYDFCAANLLTRQSGARVVAAVCLASDGGDKHGELDRFPDARISGEDWRLRFEFIRAVTPHRLTLDQPWEVAFGDAAVLRVRWLHGVFGHGSPRLEVTTDGETVFVDVVLYQGARREFHFDDGFPCCLAFAMSIDTKYATPADLDRADFRVLENSVEISWPDGPATLKLTAPRLPMPEADILEFALQSKKTAGGVPAQTV